MTLAPRGILHGSPYSWTFTDAAARTGATGFTPDDVGGWAVQLDTGTVWELTDDSPVTWAQRAPGTGMTNPMTTADDIIVGGASGAPTRVAKGGNNTVFGVDGGGTLGYKADPSGGSVATDAIWDAAGDLAVGSGANTAARLAQGANGTFLGVSGGALGYYTPGGGGSAPASASYKRTAGDYTTTSTSFVDVDGTNLSLTITTGANRVMIGLVATALNNTVNQGVAFDVTVDGTRQGGTNWGLGLVGDNGSSIWQGASFVYLTAALSAGSHTFTLQFKVTGGTGTLYGLDPACEFWIAEVA